MNRKNFLTALLSSGVGAMLLIRSPELGEGIRRGLFVCSYSVIPAIFPFMALSVFICKSSAADFFEWLLRPVTRLLRIPSVCGGILLASVIGGYPAAAKCIAEAVEEDILDRKAASKMLCFCVNAGPPFLIGAVGFSVFGSAKTGFLLFVAQLFSSLIIGLLLSAFSKKSFEKFPLIAPQRKSNSVCAVEAVISAAESSFRMCAFIILACGITEICFDGAVFSRISSAEIRAIFTGIFEVTAGALACGKIEGSAALIITGAICSFSGISVILQIAAITDESEIPLFPFFLSRFVHAAFTAGILRFFVALSGDAVSAFSIRQSKIEAVLSASAPAAVSLVCMASLFLLSLVPPKSEKEPFFSQILTKIEVFKHSQKKKDVIK